MLQSLRNRRNRKGFTLAELLIVVAIIAVLVAIAVPLFVGQVKEAEEATANANIRAVRGEASVYLLKNSENKDLWEEAKSGKVRAWVVEATVSGNGEIKLTKVNKHDVSKNAEDVAGYKAAGEATKESGTYNIKLLIKETDVVVKK